MGSGDSQGSLGGSWGSPERFVKGKVHPLKAHNVELEKVCDLIDLLYLWSRVKVNVINAWGGRWGGAVDSTLSLRSSLKTINHSP